MTMHINVRILFVCMTEKQHHFHKFSVYFCYSYRAHFQSFKQNHLRLFIQKVNNRSLLIFKCMAQNFVRCEFVAKFYEEF